MENTGSKKLTDGIVAELSARFDSDEVRSVIEATEKGADADLGIFEIVITTENVDRYGEVIKLDAWELEHYKKNPVVLWGHDHFTLPVGVTTSLAVEDGKLIARGRFAPHEHAQHIRKLYDLGVLRASSVGFIEKEREGNLITKAELIEWSFVSVPANPYALTTLIKSGLSVNDMVTKGFLNVKEGEPTEQEKPAEEEKNLDDDTEDEPDAPVDSETAPESEERSFSTKDLNPIISNLKSALVALEDMVKSYEPEGDGEAPTTDEDTRDFEEFSEKRRILQQAVTVLGDVLAKARQAVEANKQ